MVNGDGDADALSLKYVLFAVFVVVALHRCSTAMRTKVTMAKFDAMVLSVCALRTVSTYLLNLWNETYTIFIYISIYISFTCRRLFYIKIFRVDTFSKHNTFY